MNRKTTILTIAMAAIACLVLAAAAGASNIGRAKVLRSYDQKLRVTVLAVRNPARPTDEYSVPGRGKKFVAIKLRLTNLDRRVYDDSPDNGAQLISLGNRSYQPSLMGLSPDIDMIGKLFPANTRVGWMTFEVPRTVIPKYFQFALDSGFSAGAQWRLR